MVFDILCTIFKWYCVVNSILGVLGLRWAIKKCSYLFNQTEEMKKQFPAFWRDDYNNWNYPLFYISKPNTSNLPVSATLLPIRLHIYIITLLIVALTLNWQGRGSPLGKSAPPEIRKKGMSIYQGALKLLFVVCGYYSFDRQFPDYDYSKYLGPNYKTSEKYASIAFNHTSYMDVIIHRFWTCSPIGKAGIWSVPLLGRAMEIIGVMFVERSSKDSKREIIERIKDQQERKMAGEDVDHVGIFPEGTVSNGKCLLPFKSGIFHSELPVLPVYCKFQGKYFDATYDSIEIWEAIILHFCQWSNNVTIL